MIATTIVNKEGPHGDYLRRGELFLCDKFAHKLMGRTPAMVRVSVSNYPRRGSICLVCDENEFGYGGAVHLGKSWHYIYNGARNFLVEVGIGPGQRFFLALEAAE